MRSTQIELKDVATEIETMADRTSIDPERLELVNARVDLIFRLQQKHRLSSIAELIDLQQSLNTKLNSFSDLDEEIATLSAKIEEEYSILLSVAKKLSAQRSKAIADVEGQVVELLKELGLTSAVFAVENTILNDDQLTVTGLDQIKFCFSKPRLQTTRLEQSCFRWRAIAFNAGNKRSFC